MAHDLPELPELINTVREYIEAITPQLQGLDRYHALCSVQLLDVVQRELREWRPLETADDARLRALANAGPELPRSELTACLSEQIQAGHFDNRMDELQAAMLEHVIAKVAVTKPSYLAPEHRQE